MIKIMFLLTDYINQEEFGDAFTAIITNMGLKGALATPTDYEVRVGGANLAAPVVFDITVEGGEVTIMYGDCDKSGVIDGSDAIVIMQYLAEMTGLTFDEAAADVVYDGKVDGSDAILLMQYLAEMDVTLGPAAK